MDTTHWAWRSEAADSKAISSLEQWAMRQPRRDDEEAPPREALQAVVTETRRLRAILGHCPRPIAVLDLDGSLAGYNHEFERHFGDLATLGESLAARLDEPDRALFETVVSTTASEGHAGAIVALRAQDGTKKDVEFLVATLPAQDGTALGLVMAAEERREGAPAVSTALLSGDFVSAANAASAFAMAGFVVSHDVGSALATASAFIESIASRRSRGHTLDDPDVHATLLSAVASIRQAGALLEGLRRSSRPEALKIQEDADVRAATDVAVQLVGTRARSARVTITIDVPSGTLARIAPSMLTQVMTNLLANAVESTEETGRAGTVRVWVERVTGERKMMAIHVGDTGSGIDPGRLAAMFEPRQTTRAASGGRGLGLAICRHVIEGAGGTLRAASVVGQGSDFIVQLEDPGPRVH